MRITVPVSRHDLEMLPDWVDVHKALQPGNQHDLHFVVPQAVSGAAFDAASQLDGCFQSVEVHQIDVEPTGGWPLAPNVFFWHCANFMFQKNPNIPWQLVELDCLPLRSNAYDAVAGQYMNCGLPFFGSISPTPFRVTESLLDNGRPNPDYGKITNPLLGKSDVMMSGCGIYPGNLMKHPLFIGMMASFMQGMDSIDMPWDMFLRGAMKATGMAHTDLLAQHWNTGSYRIEDGQIVCDGRNEHESQQPGWEIRKCGGIVHPAAAMIHGCKDTSLRDLILNGQIPEVVMPKRAAMIRAGVVSETPPSDGKVEKLEAKVDQLTGMLEQFLKGQQAIPAKPSPVPQVAFKRREDHPTAKPDSDAAQSVFGANSTQEETVLAMLAASPKKLRAGDVAAKTRIPISELREMAKSDSCPFEVNGALGWMKIKEAALAS